MSLLDSGPNSRITEIAAKTLANMAVKDSNRTGIRLAGGIPPLMRLLLERPSEQVCARRVVLSAVMPHAFCLALLGIVTCLLRSVLQLAF